MQIRVIIYLSFMQYRLIAVELIATRPLNTRCGQVRWKLRSGGTPWKPVAPARILKKPAQRRAAQVNNPRRCPRPPQLLWQSIFSIYRYKCSSDTYRAGAAALRRAACLAAHFRAGGSAVQTSDARCEWTSPQMQRHGRKYNNSIAKYIYYIIISCQCSWYAFFMHSLLHCKINRKTVSVEIRYNVDN